MTTMKTHCFTSSPRSLDPPQARSRSAVLRALRSFSATLLIAGFVLAQTEGQRPRVVGKDPAAEAENAQISLRQSLEKARTAPSVDERISLLDKFLSANRGSLLEVEARELLMREYSLRAEQHLREGSPENAVSDFKAAYRAAPAEITDRLFSQYIFPMPVALNAFGYRTESAELMRSFEARFADEVNRLIQIGFFYVQIEAPLEAVRTLERAVKLAPQDHRGHNSLGTAYLINLRLDDAQAEFRRALELNPRDEYANLNMANLLRARGQHEQAADYYQRQLDLKPDDADAHAGLAITLLALGRDEEAEKEVTRVSQLAPENYRFFTQLAYFYAARRKTVHARAAVERAAKIEPRYAWTHITKANIDALESRFGDALSTLIPAQNLGTFPTLSFEVAKSLMALDGYDQTVEVLSDAFTLTEDGEFEAMLGGVMKARSPRLDLLLERERQAALFLNEQTTTPLQYRLAEAVARIDHYLKIAAAAKARPRPAAPRRAANPRQKGRQSRTPQRAQQARTEPAEPTRPRRTASAVDPDAELSAGTDSALPGVAELMKAITTFTTLDDGRQVFRAIWVARKLAESGVALDAAEQLAHRAVAAADRATEPDGSMRDAPLLDREGRLAVFLGRAEDALGWALLKKGDTRGAIAHLTKSVDTYPNNAERKNALWHLAVVMEEVGDEQRALDFYVAAYDARFPGAEARRARIEALYKKMKGSLDGLEERLKQPE